MALDLQPFLENDDVGLYPLTEDDFEELYAVASDPEIWKQHPNKDRWKRDVFRKFFDGALAGNGAFKIVFKETNDIVGSTRFYNYKEDERSIFLGYTFYATSCWGKGINKNVKKLMLDYIFSYVEKVYFHIGAHNVRSQIAIGRIGAQKIREEEVAYVDEPSRFNFLYELNKAQWLERK